MLYLKSQPMAFSRLFYQAPEFVVDSDVPGARIVTGMGKIPTRADVVCRQGWAQSPGANVFTIHNFLKQPVVSAEGRKVDSRATQRRNTLPMQKGIAGPSVRPRGSIFLRHQQQRG